MREQKNYHDVAKTVVDIWGWQSYEEMLIEMLISRNKYEHQYKRNATEMVLTLTVHLSNKNLKTKQGIKMKMKSIFSVALLALLGACGGGGGKGDAEEKKAPAKKTPKK